ncbi:MAG: PhzF family phenazine biosynthesis protein [Bacteroidales bacterium]
MKLEIYQVDAFASEVFRGNPAAVCMLPGWMPDGLMQQIASENNLSETAFVVPAERKFGIRWFTPVMEVDLCGHATLASAHVLFFHHGISGKRIEFDSPRSGLLAVEREGEMLTLDFPADHIEEVEHPDVWRRAMGTTPLQVFRGRSDYLLLYDGQEVIAEMKPDLGTLKELGGRGVIITARGSGTDFVSRFFAPGAGIDEDPVTGSAHTTLAVYWSKVLEKSTMSARQLSERGGELRCEVRGDRVRISGRAVTYLTGEIEVPVWD